MNTMDIEIVFNTSRIMGTIIICSIGSIGYSNLEKMAKIHFESFKKDKNRILNNSRMEYWIGLIFSMQVKALLISFRIPKVFLIRCLLFLLWIIQKGQKMLKMRQSGLLLAHYLKNRIFAGHAVFAGT